ncbi:unnamed protein product [Symbiodinium natans]|uniref:GPI inositol-deacylase n=1 Tax=Symbiodinium natans TaxID=878477 RepID=A0A812R625_9DINO|nr:unnamed protein product [Symbiodinium natans]
MAAAPAAPRRGRAGACLFAVLAPLLCSLSRTFAQASWQRPGRSALRASGRSEDEAPAHLRPVVLCPAQFGTAEDYEDLKESLKVRGFALYAAPLSRFDWLKIVPSTFTKEFFTAELRPNRTLGFFYEALDQAIAAVDADFGPEEPIAFLGHSIGGWVARSYIGEVLGEELARKRVRSLVTLGTPHQSPPEDSFVSALDQTRGLLSYINDKFPSGAPLPPASVTCVAGRGTRVPASVQALWETAGTKIWNETVSRSTLLEEVVAFASYLPLSGSTFGVEGDGLIPVDTALMEGCQSVVARQHLQARIKEPSMGQNFGQLPCYVYYWSFGSRRYYSWKLALSFGPVLAFALCAHMTWAAGLLFRRRVPCRKALALTGCLWLASITGLWAGDQNYGHYTISYYTYQDLVSYTDVDPAHAKGQTYMDAGEVYFKEGTEVATSEMVSFRSRTNFCAAPIIGQPLRNQAGLEEVKVEGDVIIPEAGSVDFWAVGTDCCDKASRTFTCGQVHCSAGCALLCCIMASATHAGHWAAIAPQDRHLLLGAGGITAVLAARAARVRRLGPAASSLAAALGAAAVAGGVASQHGALAEDQWEIMKLTGSSASSSSAAPVKLRPPWSSSFAAAAGAIAVADHPVYEEVPQEMQVGGFSFADRKVLGNHCLSVHGRSHCRYYGLEVCAAVLYLPEGTDQVLAGGDVMDSTVPKTLELRYCRNFPGDQFRFVTRWALSRNGYLPDEAVEVGLKLFNPLYRDVKRGDCYTLSYDPRTPAGRVTLQLNGVELGSVEGRRFSEALFSVWFGQHPFLDHLKQELLLRQ